MTPGASPQAGCGTLPGARAGAGSACGRVWCRHLSLAVRQVRDRGLAVPATSSGLACARGHRRCHRWLDAGRSDRVAGVVPDGMRCRPSGSHLADATLCPTGVALCHTFASRRFRGSAARDRQGAPPLWFRFPRFDEGRMRRQTESGKTGSVALIHFWRKGQWTRVDKSTPHRKPPGCSAKSRVGGPDQRRRSRWARRRRRRALSLMKPAASFWS